MSRIYLYFEVTIRGYGLSICFNPRHQTIRMKGQRAWTIGGIHVVRPLKRPPGDGPYQASPVLGEMQAKDLTQEVTR